MKIVISLILLVSLLLCTACEVAESESTVTASNPTSSSVEERLKKVEKILEDVQKELGIEPYWDVTRKSLVERVEVLEEKVIPSGFQENIREPESLEGRVKSVERRVKELQAQVAGIGRPSSIPSLEDRVSFLEKTLGVTDQR